MSTKQAENIESLCRQRQLAVIQGIAAQPDINFRALAEHCSSVFQLPLSSINVQPCLDLIQYLELESLVKRYFAIPVTLQNNWLTLAISDPSDNDTLLAFQFATGLYIRPQLCDISQALDIITSLNSTELCEPATSQYQALPETSLIETDSELTSPKDDPNATPIGQYIHQVILYGVQQGASDIHFEPFEQKYRIRMRIDGLLTTTHVPDKHSHRRLASRLKLLAQLNIAEKRLPQDGRIQLTLEHNQKLDLRVSTLPTLWGEKVVLRILNSGTSNANLEQIGLPDSQLSSLHQILRSPQGLIIITGPTGSGKTTTLYAILEYLNQERRNISTVEDPIEIQLDGINQIQTNDSIELDFSTVLRALLRQDPDIIMVGEIRDAETAKMAMRAAQTGHLVLSTLHTNSAYEASTRLNQMGIAEYQLLSSLKLVIAKRLLRKLCSHCKEKRSEHDDSYVLSQRFYANSVGCRHCLSGYRGRIGLYDFFQPTSNNDITSADINKCQLWRQGLLLVEQGITSLEELTRVVEPSVAKPTL